jgi:2-polyprenyl-3-methyl-5-hydroxy-6-metoxy-1,4-benzoquinol methylase
MPDRRYYENCQDHLLAMVPRLTGKTVLELGCGTGATLAAAKEQGAASCAGVERLPEVADLARQNRLIDEVFIADLDQGLAFLGSRKFDVIVLSHVLEHLVDPWGVLRQLRAHLLDGACIVGEVPNIRHLGILLRLAFRDDFRYRSEGILDRTHLRFFTQTTLAALLKDTGFCCQPLQPRVLGARSRLGHALTAGLVPGLFAMSYAFVATPRP